MQVLGIGRDRLARTKDAFKGQDLRAFGALSASHVWTTWPCVRKTVQLGALCRLCRGIPAQDLLEYS